MVSIEIVAAEVVVGAAVDVDPAVVEVAGADVVGADVVGAGDVVVESNGFVVTTEASPPSAPQDTSEASARTAAHQSRVVMAR
jgi:hypothetical protein